MLVLSHSIGTDHGMWAPQMEDLLPHFQVLRYDTRGHGASDAPGGEYSVERLGRDVIGLADALKIPSLRFVVSRWAGPSDSGSRSMRRIGVGLVLANTSPQFGPRANWESRIQTASEKGMAGIAEMVMPRFFSSETLARTKRMRME